EDLVSHLRVSDTRCRAAAPAEDHFLSLDPTVLTVDLIEQNLLAAETSVFANSGLLLLVLSAAPARARVVGVVAVAAGVVVGAAEEVVEAVEVVAVVGVVAGVGALVEAVVAAVGVAVLAAVGVVAVGLELLSVERGASGGSGSCPYVIRTGDRDGQTSGKPHTQYRYFSRVDDASRAEFGDEAERPCRAELLKSGVAIFDLDYDAILAAMYALSDSAEGDCYLYVPPNLGLDAAALGASESFLPGTAPTEALHTFTLNSGVSHCFFRDSTTLTLLSAPVRVRQADPSRGPDLARSSTVLPCPAVPSGSLSGLHLPSFSTNLVCTAALQDAMVTATTPGGQRVSICTCTRTGRHLATFTRRPSSSLYTLATGQSRLCGQVCGRCSRPSAEVDEVGWSLTGTVVDEGGRRPGRALCGRPSRPGYLLDEVLQGRKTVVEASMANVTLGGYLEVETASLQGWQFALVQRWQAADLLCWQVAFLQRWRGASTQRWQAVDHAVLAVDLPGC
ncbi:unnamed protein product, partial [Closterium sp. NIES-53]